jgi:hypothetical protein
MTGMDKVKAAKSWLKNAITFPGGYTIGMYLVDGERLCQKCALENWKEIVGETLHPGRGDPSWGIACLGVYWEGPPEPCCQCSKIFESEYGDPESSDEED